MMEGRKCFIQRHTQHILFTVIWNDGRKEMFYSTIQSTHFIYGYIEWWKEGNVLFNDTVNTFYLRLYRMMEGRKCFIQRYSQHILFTVIWNDGRKEMFYSTTHSLHFYLQLYGMMEGRKCFIQRHTQHIFIYSYMEWWKEHWLEREIAQWVHPMKDRSDDRSHHERMLLYINVYKPIVFSLLQPHMLPSPGQRFVSILGIICSSLPPMQPSSLQPSVLVREDLKVLYQN